MACDALRKLGKERLAVMFRDLVGGEPVKMIARTIQEDWGEAEGVSRVDLERELTSLRLSISECGLGNKRSEPSIISDDGLQLSPLDWLTRLVQFHATRIDRLHKKELAQGKPIAARARRLEIMQIRCADYRKCVSITASINTIKSKRQAANSKQPKNRARL